MLTSMDHPLLVEPYAMASPDDARLSDREREVVCLLSCGLAPNEIAERFGITRKTVDTHRGNIVKKTGARNNCDLVRWCLTYGLINLDGTVVL